MEKSTDTLQARQIMLTRGAFLWNHILRAPFWAVYNLLLFILYKDLHASPFQIGLFIALKPGVSLLSMYWGHLVNQRPDRLISNIIWASVIGYFPFFFFPFFYSSWFVLFGSAIYMMMHRGVVPAWMEILKLNLPKGTKEKVFSYGSILSYIIGALLPLVVGPILDHYVLAWRWFFVLTAFFGISAIFFIRKIPIPFVSKGKQKEHHLGQHLLHPWKSSISILSKRPDFRNYQIGFMLFGGCGLMIMQPALPKFFVDVLALSYTELSVALLICKGAGFVLTSPLWARGMSRFNIFRFGGFVTTLGGLFPLVLLCGPLHIFFIYLAYFTYGVMQAGSELVWHLAGPHFAHDQDSAPYSNLSIFAVGIRGLVIPQIGSFLIFYFPSTALLIAAAFLCLAGTLWMRRAYKQHLSPSLLN
ncbi:MAG: MFS transporter [Chlamydiia bacterium]|nr:MFS transporter [Chlamydiia bacterium]